MVLSGVCENPRGGQGKLPGANRRLYGACGARCPRGDSRCPRCVFLCPGRDFPVPAGGFLMPAGGCPMHTKGLLGANKRLPIS